MKISNKIFAVASAALLLASCSNFAPTDYANKDTKEYYGEEYTNDSQKPFSGDKIDFKDFKVINSCFTSGFSIDKASWPVTATVTFSDDVDEASAKSGIKIAKAVFPLDAKDVITFTGGPTADVEVEEGKIVTLKFTATDGYYFVKVNSTVKSVAGRALDQDGDGIPGEEADDIYMAYLGTGPKFDSATYKGILWPLADINGAATLPIPTINVIKDSTAQKPERLEISLAEPEGLLPPDYKSLLSNHVVLYVEDVTTGEYNEKTLSFEDSTDNITKWTTYKAMYSVNLAKDGSAYLAAKDLDTFKATIGGTVYRFNTDDRIGKTLYKFYKFGSTTDINPWRKVNTGTIDLTGAKQPLSYVSGYDVPSSFASIKIVVTDLVDANHDGNLDVPAFYYKDGIDYIPLFTAHTLVEDKEYTNVKAYSNSAAVKISGGLYIEGDKGDKGDTCKVEVYTRRY